MNPSYRPYFATKQEKDQAIERWQNALRVLEQMTEHERKKHFQMRDWGHKTDCGTVACLAGFCGLDPWFRDRGLKFSLINPNDPNAWDMWFENDVSPEDFFKDPLHGCQMFYYTEKNHAEMVNHVKTHIARLARLEVRT